MQRFVLSVPYSRTAWAAVAGLTLCALAAAFGPHSAYAEEAGRTELSGVQNAVAGGGQLLEENQVVRFVASLADMHRLGPGVARSLRMGEINPDDPLVPYARLVKEARTPEPEVAAVLADNGFTTLEEWLSIGDSVMLAYWAREDETRRLGLAVQLAPLIFAVQGQSDPSAQEVSDLVDKLKAHMEASSEQEAPPPANLLLVGKYHEMIGEALRER